MTLSDDDPNSLILGKAFPTGHLCRGGLHITAVAETSKNQLRYRQYVSSGQLCRDNEFIY